nr:MAG TPA: hypothetical protein [Caudoviricetes sp.]DAV08827.1 MAG TPA: hypothetical protein [Caudoviricetes sp.]
MWYISSVKNSTKPSVESFTHESTHMCFFYLV